MCDCIPYRHFFGYFDTGDQVAHVASTHGLLWDLVHTQNTYLVSKILLAGVHKLDFVSLI